MAARNNNGKVKRAKAPVEAYIPCQVQPGMFRGEYLVTFEARDFQNPEETVSVQLLADEHEVTIPSGKPERGRPVGGLLRVEVLRKGKGLTLVVLPQPAQPVGERVYVGEELVREKAET